MPSHLVLHIGNALAFHGLHDDGCGHALGGSRLSEGRAELIEIISIRNPYHMESEALKLLGNRIGGIDHIYRSVDLQPVVVHDHAQIVEFLGCREHGCLPHLSLLDLAVAQKRVYTVVLIAELRGECHAHRDGNSLAQRSAGSVHPRRVLYTGMSLEMGADVLYPKISICDPTYLYTLPPAQTAAGTADIMSHVLEQYFQPCDTAWLTDRLSEEVLKTCIRYCPVALEEPENYEARANLMWASTLGLNHILTAGKGGAWSCHPMEHQLSAFYDITHGAGLAILTPAWMRYVLCDRTAGRFALYARQVWDVEAEDDYQAAEEGICCTESFFRKIGLPSTLSEVGIGPEHFREMAEKAVEVSGIATRSYYHLGAEDIVKIFESCLG